MLNPRLLFVAVVWGSNFAFVKYALADFYPLSFTIIRFSCAALFLVVVMIADREPLAVERRDLGPIIALGFIGITLYNLFFMYGLSATTASNSALLISLSPLFAAFIQAASRRERLTVAVLAGLALSSIGVFLVIRSGPGGLGFTSRDLPGDLLTLCAALFWALYTVRSRPLLAKYSAVKVTAYSMIAGTVLLLPLGARELVKQAWETVSPLSWAALAFSAFIAGGIAFTLWYQGVQRIGVTKTIVYHYLVPFVALLFAALFLREEMTLSRMVGGAAILVGVAIVQRDRGALSRSR